jgi:phosphoglycerate dehydrogenase-like enzyme
MNPSTHELSYSRLPTPVSLLARRSPLYNALVRKRITIVADVDEEFQRAVAADERFEVELRLCRSEEELADAAAKAHVLVTRSFVPVTARVLDDAAHLELILQGTSGLDNIDVATAEARGIRVVTAPGSNANAVAELVVGLIVSLTRTVPAYDREMRRGAWPREGCASRRELRSLGIGIVGLGRVGSRLAALLEAFGCSPRAYDPYLDRATMEGRSATKIDTLEELVSTSEILSLHVPLTDETRGMVGGPLLDHLPHGAIVINTSRGEVLDLDAALERLERGRLGGLALDVFAPEPPQRDWPDHPNLILTPHIAGCTSEAKAHAGRALYEELCRFYVEESS